MEMIVAKLEDHFARFEPQLQEELSKIGRIRQFKSGEQLISGGEPIKYAMLVTKGRIKLYTEGENGEEFFMYYLEPGQACALSFVCAARNKRSDIEAFAIEDSEALVIPIEYMDELMLKYKSWYVFVIESYRVRYQELLDAIRSIAFQAMDERLEYYLIRQKNAFNSKILNLTHEQIANDLNSSRVVISRLLKQMENNHRLKLHRSSIELLF
jgi:CRP/FNR family transcriptional regulator